MKILITGGHLTPALAVIDKLTNLKEKTDVVFVGRKYGIDSEQTISLEYKEVTKRNIPFISLQAGRITRIVSLKGLTGIFRIPLGFFHAIIIINRERPSVILTFGGYIALPIAIVGNLFRIPVFTHEQTIAPGLANRVIAFFSKKIFYSFPEASSYFPSAKSILTGNPVRKSIFIIDKKPFEVNKTLPVVYITGGSLGSHSINIHIKEIIGDLLKDMTVIHQTGNVKEYNDYEKLTRFRRSLPEELKNRYFITEHFFDEEIGYVYSLADVIVARAGANTFFEAIHLQKPAIFIPLPWSANKEQQRHAQFFRNYEIGEVFEQKEPSVHLAELIKKVIKNRQKYKSQFQKIPLAIKRDAADVIIKEILNT